MRWFRLRVQTQTRWVNNNLTLIQDIYRHETPLNASYSLTFVTLINEKQTLFEEV